MRFLMASKANRRSIRSAGHYFYPYRLGTCRLVLLDRRIDADKIAPGFRAGHDAGDCSGRPICGRRGIGLGTLVEALPAGLPPALGAILDIDRRVAIKDVRDPIAEGVIGTNGYQGPASANRLGIY